VAQTPLVITNNPTRGYLGTSLPITFSGGSGTGLVSFNVVGYGCNFFGSYLNDLGATSCVVTVSKDASFGYLAATSAPVTFTFTQPALTAPSISVNTSANNIVVLAMSPYGPFYGQGNGTNTALAKINGTPVNFGTNYQLSRGTFTVTVTFNSQVIYTKQITIQ
jgi:hypothetical protein